MSQFYYTHMSIEGFYKIVICLYLLVFSKYIYTRSGFFNKFEREVELKNIEI